MFHLKVTTESSFYTGFMSKQLLSFWIKIIEQNYAKTNSQLTNNSSFGHCYLKGILSTIYLKNIYSN